MAGNTIAQIFGAVLGIVTGWQPTTSVENDIADGFLVVNGAHEAWPNTPLVAAAYKDVTKTEAGLQNLTNGQLAQLGSYHETFPDYGDDVVDVFLVRRFTKGGAPAGSPAENVKAQSGT